jgi:hypothetical protein
VPATGAQDEIMRPAIARRRRMLEVDMPQAEVGFQSEIRPLFREKDIQSMSTAFDLSSYDDVKASAQKILAALSNGSMPCDGPWPADRVALFREWVDAGCPA